MEVVFPLSEEVELWLCAYPSFVRLIIVWLSAYPYKCRGDLFCALPLSVEVIFERGVVYSQIVFAPNPQWRFPVWEVQCGRVSENPSV